MRHAPVLTLLVLVTALGGPIGCSSEDPAGDWRPVADAGASDAALPSHGDTDAAAPQPDARRDGNAADAATSDDDATPALDVADNDSGRVDAGRVDAGLPDRTVTIATWNVQRFFDATCASSCADGDFERQFSEAQLRFKAEQVASAIEELEADIVVLQEIETQQALDALLAELPAGRYPIAELGEIGFAGSLDVAILAAGELDEVRTHRQDPIARPSGGTTTFSRELLEVHLRIDDRPVVVFATHFKSKNDDDPSRRLAEGIAARGIVLDTTDERPEALVVLGGDLNDTPGSPPLEALERDGDLLRVSSELGDEAWTTRFGDDRNAIDHLYFATDSAGAYIEGTAEVIRDGNAGFGSSDHAALRAVFRLPDEPEDARGE